MTTHKTTAVLGDYLAALDTLIQPIAAAALPTGQQTMPVLLAALGNPHRRLRVVMVAGSTGKGSTAWQLAGHLAAAGQRIGLYTSPHLHSFRERIRLHTAPTGQPFDPALISQADFTTAAARVTGAARQIGLHPSTFEAATALAYLHFADRAVDVAVMEIGIGGRYDAVRVLPPMLALITPIETEHAAMLGGTLESIAWHKAGIIPPGGHALTVPQHPAVHAVLAAEAAQHGAMLTVTDDLAATAAHWLGVTPLALPAALPPGRLEHVTVRGVPVIIDGGHTPRAAAYVRQHIAGHFPGLPCRAVIGMLADKDAAGFLATFEGPGWTIQPIDTPTDRGLPASALRAAYPPSSASLTDAQAGHTLEEVFAGLGKPHSPEVVLITGSLRVAAAARVLAGLLPADLRAEAVATAALFDGAGYRQRWQRR